jgi:hypothetical protein
MMGMDPNPYQSPECLSEPQQQAPQQNTDFLSIKTLFIVSFIAVVIGEAILLISAL